MAEQFPSVREMHGFLRSHEAHLRDSFLGNDAQEVARGVQAVITGIRDAAMRNPSILQVSPASVLKAGMVCARMGLFPGGPSPDVYLVPRNMKTSQGWVKEVQAQTSWRGVKKLVERNGVRSLRVRPVFRGEPFVVKDGTNGAYLEHEQLFDIPRDWDSLVACYVLGRIRGEVIHHVIGKDNIIRHRDSSDSYKRGSKSKGPWVEHPVQMAMKTAIHDAVARGTFPLLDAQYEAALLGEVEEVPNVIVDRPQETPIKKAGSLGLLPEEIIDVDATTLQQSEPEQSQLT
jgi:phage RecT family recombinase|tara:strand:- start:12029 stop:12892 length:864 start_codon:yes stop_codon:yes gene_type:complete